MDQDVVPPIGGGEPDPDGVALDVAVHRQADRRLPAHVERRRERGEPPSPPNGVPSGARGCFRTPSVTAVARPASA
jgi:hypothetical protein